MSTLASPVAPAHAVVPEPPPRATVRMLVLAAGVAVIGDIALHAGILGVAGALTIAAASLMLLRSGRLERAGARGVVAAAPLFGVWLAVRTSPWLIPLDVAAAVGLLVVGAGLARSGSLRDLPPIAVVLRAAAAFEHLVWAPAMVRFARSTPVTSERRRQWRAVGVGVALAIPVVLVLGALLASADVVFASLFDGADLRADRITLHAFGLLAVGWAALGLLRTASANPPGEVTLERKWVGRTEATVVLGAVVVLFAAFGLTQLVTATGGADHILSTAGLTRAEYAREGFFQLLWVAGLTITGLLVLAHVAELDGVRRALAAAVVALAVVIVGVAVWRLDLYRDAYGWTMLRLACTAVAAWLGVVLALLGVALAGPAPVRRLGWFVPAAGAAGLAILLALNVANPEAMVARYNLTREATVAIDTSYLDHLSDDALPTIVALLPNLDESTEAELRLNLGCALQRGEERAGWARWNLARSRAEAARQTLCQV